MYLIRRATSNATAHGILASLTTNISYAERNQLQNAINLVSRYLQICLRWTARLIRQAIAGLWRALRIADLLHAIQLIFLRILKWCRIALATAIGVTIILHLGYWGLPKLLEIYRESRRRRLEERRQNEERKQYAAYLSELRARQAAQAAAIKEARLRQSAEAAARKETRLRQAREDQAIKDKLKREEERKQIKARADYMRWKEECDIVFQDRASMTKFPFPPLPRCAATDCPGFLKVPAPACQHNVKQFFKESGNLSLEFLKRQRHLWHEDRFASCREDLRPEFRRLANSLFVVLDPWYEALKGK